jgi:hypothetical protein
MKNSIVFSILITFCVIISACSESSKSESSKSTLGGTGDVGGGTMSATYDGVEWKALEVRDNSFTNIQKVFWGYDSTRNIGYSMNFDVERLKTGNVIQIEKDNVYEGITVFTLDKNKMPTNQKLSRTATITITNATDKLVEGTFSFITGKTPITNGKFSVQLTKFFK